MNSKLPSLLNDSEFVLSVKKFSSDLISILFRFFERYTSFINDLYFESSINLEKFSSFLKYSNLTQYINIFAVKLTQYKFNELQYSYYCFWISSLIKFLIDKCFKV